MSAVKVRQFVFVSMPVPTTSVTTIGFCLSSRLQSGLFANQMLVFIFVIAVGHKILLSFPRLCILYFLLGLHFSLLLQSFRYLLVPLFTLAQGAQLIFRRRMLSLEEHDVSINALLAEGIRQDTRHFRYVMSEAQTKNRYITQGYSICKTFSK